VFENLIELQKDVSLSVQEVTKMQKVYKDEEHVTHDARIKAADADDKYVCCYLGFLFQPLTCCCVPV
jgi:hypothetical protein